MVLQRPSKRAQRQKQNAQNIKAFAQLSPAERARAYNANNRFVSPMQIRPGQEEQVYELYNTTAFEE